MAKAALNMLTLTSAPTTPKDGIYMNAVDTGWVTDEDPAHMPRQSRSMHDFQPPLDIVDGAARILDPVFSSLLTGAPVWGQVPQGLQAHRLVVCYPDPTMPKQAAIETNRGTMTIELFDEGLPQNRGQFREAGLRGGASTTGRSGTGS